MSNQLRSAYQFLLLLGLSSFLILSQIPSTAAEESGKQEQPAPAATVNMTGDLRYVPDTVTIKRGEAVLWQNTSNLVHTVTDVPELASDQRHAQLPAEAKSFNSGDIYPGETYRHTFSVPGVYRYFCIPHESAGMVGTVIVESRE